MTPKSNYGLFTDIPLDGYVAYKKKYDIIRHLSSKWIHMSIITQEALFSDWN